MERATRPATWQVVLAFGIVYFVWGSTFLAIRIGVREVPSFLLAAMRFLLAGLGLYLWMRVRGVASPSRREWMSAALLSVLIFVIDYGLLFWAERRVPSGVAAVMLATIPLFMTLSEIFLLGTQQLTARLALALLVGIGGVAVLVSPSMGLGESACAADLRDELVHRLGADAQAAAAGFQADEFGGADAVRRNLSRIDSGGAGRVSRLSSAAGFARRLDRAGVPHGCRLHHRVHRLCLAHSS